MEGREREAPGEARQLGNDHRLEACLAIDMVVAWRLFPLTKLGREIPDAPKPVFFEEDEEGRSHIFGAQASCAQRDGWL